MSVNKLTITRSKTKNEFLPIKIDVESFFSEQDKQVRILYRTCSNKFGNEGPGNLVPKKIVPDRIVIFFDFYNENVSISNLRRIIAFTEKVGEELREKYPLFRSRFGMDKIDLEKLPKKYIFESISDLKQNYQNVC